MRLTHLAGICDRLDDCRGAMRYAADANRLSGELSARKGVDKTRFLEFVENRKRYFQRDNIRQWRPDTERAETSRPVFVIGFPRSGTTLIDTMLRGHPHIEVAEESDAVPTLVNRLSGVADAALGSLGALTHKDIESARAEYYERLARHVRPSRENATFVDRFALNTVYAGEIHRVFPDARFILMLRHPADCVLSCYLRTFTETSANASFHTLEEAAFLYDRVFDLWVRYTEVLELDAIEVKYENLVGNVEATCRPVLEFLGLPWHPGILDHERTARNRPYIRTASYDQVIEPVHTRASGRWRRYREFLEPVLPNPGTLDRTLRIRGQRKPTALGVGAVGRRSPHISSQTGASGPAGDSTPRVRFFETAFRGERCIQHALGEHRIDADVVARRGQRPTVRVQSPARRLN